ncbi:hypothetical protein K439DRAFT_1409758 [Ramaria rubella]|nr:hypothetical protein K439DRAFT_1409758 [Ramaria rubella]
MASCSNTALRSGVDLPANFSQNASLPATNSYVTACIDFLTSPLVSSLLECHPNDIAINGPKQEWSTWWKWAATNEASWKLLVPRWVQHPASDVPVELKRMLDTVDQLTLPRCVNTDKLYPSSPADETSPLRGMSPKKSHEVFRMSAFINSVISQSPTVIKHAVDIGAGQGYLSRALSNYPLSMNVLALDFSEIQTKGAERRTGNVQKKLPKTARTPGVNGHASDPSGGSRSLAHEILHITPHTLQSSVSRWVSTQSASGPPTPVLLVALHACGSLTPDILRCFLANHYDSPLLQSPNSSCNWYAAGLVVVGCCYNLMSPSSDFPLSTLVSNENDTHSSKLYLSYNHRSLAAQSPLQWSLNTSTKATAQLAIRKVVYRALYGLLTAPTNPPVNPDSAAERPIKIGRLPDSAYSSVQEFISEANKKTGTHLPITPVDERAHRELMSCLEVLHVLRSRIGPIVESLILIDRYLYLTENTRDSDVFALNLFDQELGSGRNVVLAVLPPKNAETPL